QTRRQRAWRRAHHQACAGAPACPDQPIEGAARRGPPARCNHACESRSGADPAQQSSRTSTRTTQGRVRTGIIQSRKPSRLAAVEPRPSMSCLSLRRGCPAQAGQSATQPRDSPLFLLEAEPGELLLEARKPAAAVDQLLLAAGPGRVRLGVDVEAQRVARLAPGRAGGELGAIGHDDLDGVVLGMGVGLHGQFSRYLPRSSLELLKVAALYITPPA